MELDVVIGSGGVLSHAPSRMQAALMMIDGFAVEGVTLLAVDSIFMMPHLGVLSSVHPQAAQEIFENDCLIKVGVSVVPVFPQHAVINSPLADVYVDGVQVGSVEQGIVSRISLSAGLQGTLRVVPVHKSVDIGAGAGVVYERAVDFGECGLIVDGRNRPFMSDSFSVESQRAMYRNLGLLECE
jgi:hypothetical protein